MAARPVRGATRWIGRYLGGRLGEPTGWFDCTDAAEWNPAGYVRPGWKVYAVVPAAR